MFNALLRLLTEAVGANAAAEPTRREEMVSFILGYDVVYVRREVKK